MKSTAATVAMHQAKSGIARAVGNRLQQRLQAGSDRHMRTGFQRAQGFLLLERSLVRKRSPRDSTDGGRRRPTGRAQSNSCLRPRAAYAPAIAVSFHDPTTSLRSQDVGILLQPSCRSLRLQCDIGLGGLGLGALHPRFCTHRNQAPYLNAQRGTELVNAIGDA